MQLTHEEIGALIKELADLVTQEQSPSDSVALNKRLGDVFVELVLAARRVE